MCGQVLETLQQVGCPPPIEDICEEPEECEVEEKAKQPKQKKIKMSPKKSSSVCAYKAGEFKELFGEFVKGKKQEGFSHRDALLQWGKSDVRGRICLSLKRKRENSSSRVAKARFCVSDGARRKAAFSN